MSVEERLIEAPSGWPTAQELQALTAKADLVLLPDRVYPEGDTLVAAFREEAQAFRVDALNQGLKVELATPPEAEVAAYREHAAEWVLPFVLGIPAAIVVPLITNRIQRWLDERRPTESVPVLKYREATVIDGNVRVREVEGPADEVIAALTAGLNASSAPGVSARPPLEPGNGN